MQLYLTTSLNKKVGRLAQSV